jgi:glycosyltransferase involved in cell wall biosynthesis
MRTLLAHEWIAEVGGSENVFEQMRLAVQHDRAACLWNDDPVRFVGLEETWLARSPFRGRKIPAMPFMGSAWKRVDLSGVDRVVVSSHAFAHHLASRAAIQGIPAFAYVHSPARYVWVPDLDERGNSAVARLGRSYFRHWDRRHISPEVSFAANSRFVAQRMVDTWGVKARVIYPPVDIARIQSDDADDTKQSTKAALPSEFVLGASRLVGYKNLDAAIRAGEILRMPVVIAGTGPDEARLREVAGRSTVPVEFVGRVSDSLLVELYRRASLFVYMAVEDFGIMPVEAMACATPVLVNEIGGASESVAVAMGGLATKWERSDFADPGAVEKAIDVDMAPAVSTVNAFSVEAFRTNFNRWLSQRPNA